MAGKTTKKKKIEIVVDYKPIDHVLVPKVEVASEDDLTTLAGAGITRDKLPLIKQNDPAVAFLRLKPGDVVKFHRKSLVTGGENLYFRLVISE